MHLLATTSLSVLLGTQARTMAQLELLTILIILPLKMLSSGVTPHESIPEIVQNIILIRTHHSLRQIRPSYFISGRGMGSRLAVFFISLVTLSKTSGAFLRPLQQKNRCMDAAL
jgi:hypothetical protein